jgi:Tol biopolymer transport system component
VILFTADEAGIYRVPAAGGEATRVTKLDPARGEVYHFWPQFLPDGRHFLYLVGQAKREDSALYVGSLEGGEAVRLMQSNSRAVYAPPGYLLYVREGTLLAHPFDLSALRLTDEPLAVAERVGNFSSTGNAFFSASADGRVLAYQSGDSPTRLVWVGRGGGETGSVGTPALFYSPRLSPDGQRLAASVVDPKNGTNDIWIYDLARGASTRFTSDPGLENTPVWSPDGRRIAYAHDRDGAPHLFWKSLGDAGEGEMLTPSVGSPQSAFDFTPDGRLLLYTAREAKTGHDILTLQLDGERKSSAFLRTQFNENSARLSPDGRWVAYASNESGRYEVYVRPFPEGGAPAQVSNAGGAAPRWRRDGRELFYVTLPPDQSVVAVPVGVEGGAFKAGAPAPLFKVELSGNDYDVSADGQRFLINTTAGVPPTPLTVKTGWAAALKR